MPDAIFENPRLVGIYDAFDGERDDLQPYLDIAKEFKARSVLDIGCGTGNFSCLLNKNGFNVIGLEPAKASLDIAKSKEGSSGIQWILGDTSCLPLLSVDLAVMTGNVAQVFENDAEWEKTLSEVHKVLKPDGHLVFEIRNPVKKTWENWTRDKTYRRLHVPHIGFVEGWCEVTNVSGRLVSFVWTYVFDSDQATLASHSTLCFRTKEDIEKSLVKTGFFIKEVRDAPDRPGQEFVFIVGVK